MGRLNQLDNLGRFVEHRKPSPCPSGILKARISKAWQPKRLNRRVREDRRDSNPKANLTSLRTRRSLRFKTGHRQFHENSNLPAEAFSASSGIPDILRAESSEIQIEGIEWLSERFW
jgi:hypothetical protein